VLVEAIRERWSKWFKKDFASFPDQPRSGAPSKLSDKHRVRLREWVATEPLTSQASVNRLKTDCGVGISAGTLRNELKRMGMCGNGHVTV
jgi:transposase